MTARFQKNTANLAITKKPHNTANNPQKTIKNSKKTLIEKNLEKLLKNP
jgi:hypothetical protein